MKKRNVQGCTIQILPREKYFICTDKKVIQIVFSSKLYAYISSENNFG